jgi:hypothetical protein
LTEFLPGHRIYPQGDLETKEMARDLRRYARQTNVRLFAGFLLILFLIGDGLIFIIYGREAAMLGLICIIAGLLPLALIWIALALIDWVVQRANRK